MMNKDNKIPSNNLNGNNQAAVVTYVTLLNLSHHVQAIIKKANKISLRRGYRPDVLPYHN